MKTDCDTIAVFLFKTKKQGEEGDSVKTSLKKRISVILICVLVLFAGIPAISAHAGDGGEITVDFYATAEGTFPFPRGQLVVKDGLAEEYGYTVATVDHNGLAVEGPVVMDALVAAHKLKYKDAFTKETAIDYLVFEKGMIRKAFGKKTDDFGFWIDNKYPADGAGTGYPVDTARLSEGQNLVFWAYLSEYYGDYYTFFDRKNVTLKEGESVTLNLQGTMALSFGLMPFGPIYSKKGADGLAIVMVNGQTGDVTTVPEKTTDEKGNVTLSFDAAGTYYVSAQGFEESGLWPIVPPWCTVEVKAEEEQPQPQPTDPEITPSDPSGPLDPEKDKTILEPVSRNMPGGQGVVAKKTAVSPVGTGDKGYMGWPILTMLVGFMLVMALRKPTQL